MDTFFSFAWVGYLAVAGYLLISRRGNVLLLLGLVGMSLGGLSYALERWEVLSLSDLEPFQQAISVASPISIVFLLLGVLGLALRQSQVGAEVQGSRAENVATLIVPRSESNTYAQAESLRDEACDRLAALAQADGIKVFVQKSNAYSPDVWFRIDYWLPESDPNVSLRAFVAVTVERLEFHRFSNLFTVQTRAGTEVKRFSGLLAIDDDAAARIHRHLTTTGVKLRLSRRVREYPWQLWRPSNKIKRIRPDWALLAGIVGALATSLVPVIGPLLVMVGLLAVFLWSRKRRTYVLTSGRPLTEPRRLSWMDSWQVTVGGLAPATDAFSAEVKARILAGAPPDLALSVERIAYWGVDGQIQRDQIAVRHRRALGLVHVVPYGENLYVGWECHLNSAAWIESPVARGIDRMTGRLVHANRVVSGSHQLNEYDVADANFLSEWLHQAIRRELTLKIAEFNIDQEIDFSIQRESRKDALESSATHSGAAKPAAKKLFQRTA